MLNKFGSVYNYAMTNIQILVNAYYAFYRLLKTSSYVVDLLYKDKYLYNDIFNINNGRRCYNKDC